MTSFVLGGGCFRPPRYLTQDAAHLKRPMGPPQGPPAALPGRPSDPMALKKVAINHQEAVRDLLIPYKSTHGHPEISRNPSDIPLRTATHLPGCFQDHLKDHLKHSQGVLGTPGPSRMLLRTAQKWSATKHLNFTKTTDSQHFYIPQGRPGILPRAPRNPQGHSETSQSTSRDPSSLPWDASSPPRPHPGHPRDPWNLPGTRRTRGYGESILRHG